MSTFNKRTENRSAPHQVTWCGECLEPSTMRLLSMSVPMLCLAGGFLYTGPHCIFTLYPVKKGRSMVKD